MPALHGHLPLLSRLSPLSNDVCTVIEKSIKVGAAIPKVSSDARIFPEVLRVFVSLPSQEDGFLYSATPRKSKKDESSDDSSSGTSASCESSSTRKLRHEILRKIRAGRVQQLDADGFRKRKCQRGRSDSADAVGI